MLDQIEVLLADVPDVLSVQGSVEFAAITQRPLKVSPTLFVIPLREQYAENTRSTGPLAQKATEKFAVVIGLRDSSARQRSNALLQSIRKSVRRRLFGVVINDVYDPIELGAGGVVGAFHNTFYWQDEFITGHHEFSEEQL